MITERCRPGRKENGRRLYDGGELHCSGSQIDTLASRCPVACRWTKIKCFSCVAPVFSAPLGNRRCQKGRRQPHFSLSIRYFWKFFFPLSLPLFIFPSFLFVFSSSASLFLFLPSLCIIISFCIPTPTSSALVTVGASGEWLEMCLLQSASPPHRYREDFGYY